MITINIKNHILDLNLEINEGDFVAISGKSGSGKTTLLRVLAGLDNASGDIKVGDKVFLSDTQHLRVQDRNIGFVFQDYALFDNMSVERNLLYVSKDKALSDKLLDITQMSLFKDRLPKTLSGGQKQRVAICRALMRNPNILLLDEALSALDPQMRTNLQNILLNLHKEFNVTTIMVSHDPSEIYRLTSRVIVIEGGKIIKDGSPKDVLLHTSGSQKFSFEGKILGIKKVDLIFIAVVAIGQQLVEIVISEDEAKDLKDGELVVLSTKAFNVNIKKI